MSTGLIVVLAIQCTGTFVFCGAEPRGVLRIVQFPQILQLTCYCFSEMTNLMFVETSNNSQHSTRPIAESQKPYDFDVFTETRINMTVFRDTAPCILVNIERRLAVLTASVMRVMNMYHNPALNMEALAAHSQSTRRRKQRIRRSSSYFLAWQM